MINILKYNYIKINYIKFNSLYLLPFLKEKCDKIKKNC